MCLFLSANRLVRSDLTYLGGNLAAQIRRERQARHRAAGQVQPGLPHPTSAWMQMGGAAPVPMAHYSGQRTGRSLLH